MSNEKKEEEKLLVFKGKQYIAVPEKIHRCCKGCELENKGCYTSIRALAICRQGYIFKRKTEKD